MLRLVCDAAGRGCYSISPVFLGGATYHIKSDYGKLLMIEASGSSRVKD